MQKNAKKKHDDIQIWMPVDWEFSYELNEV